MITKQILIQYSDLQKEILDVQKKISDLEKYIDKIEEEGSVVDTVTGGNGGIQHFKIEGFPFPEYSKKKTLLLTRKSMLIQLQDELLEQTNEVEKFISEIDDSRMRRIINYRFIERLSWNRIADMMGGGNTEDSVKKAYQRFMEK